jgi:S-adenosylmethionine hydrolase
VIGNDRFGNLLTSVTAESVRELAPDGRVAILLPGLEIQTVARSYEEGGSGIAAIIGSSERLEIFVSHGDARATLGIRHGTEVKVRRI